MCVFVLVEGRVSFDWRFLKVFLFINTDEITHGAPL